MAVNEAEQAKKPKEDTPLTSLKRDIAEYCFNDNITWEGQVVVDYDVKDFTRFKTLTYKKGTILSEPLLTFELLVLLLIFFLTAIPSYILQSRYVRFHSQEDRQATYQSVVEQENNIRKFSMLLTMLAAFLLSLYMSIMIGRWWNIRSNGIGAIKAATAELTVYISTFVTKDKEVLSAIQRYSRASLRLIFLWRRDYIKDDKVLRHSLVETKILTDEEVDKLQSSTWNTNLYESIWTWHVNIVKMLYDEGLIKSEQMLVFLLGKCAQGRAGVQLIVTHCAVKVPMQYVHLLGFLVKVHNIICAILMGLLFSRAVKDRSIIICMQLIGRTLLLPFLFNAILLISAQLADPFDGGTSDFPGGKYDKGIEADSQSFLEAGSRLPKWLQDESRKATEAKELLQKSSFSGTKRTT